jgi:hypothetical protein
LGQALLQIAWVALLLLSTTLGLIARPIGVTAAAASAMLFMTVHGRPRFASTITDVWTIRASFLLGILGAIAAAATSWSASQRAERAKAHSGVEQWSSRRIRDRAAPTSYVTGLATPVARRSACTHVLMRVSAGESAAAMIPRPPSPGVVRGRS